MKEGPEQTADRYGDNVPDALWQVYEAETGEGAIAENSFAENSE